MHAKKNFELCFELPGGKKYIIPELLSASSLDFPWETENNLRLKYVYDFMPAGIMTRFIVKIHDLIKDDCYWKEGVVVSLDGAKAQIVKSGRVVDVALSGTNKKALLSTVRRHMKEINDSFTNLKVDEKVPCICTECVENAEPYFHKYQDLLKALGKGRKESQCKNSFEMLSIEALLGGIETKEIRERDLYNTGKPTPQDYHKQSKTPVPQKAKEKKWKRVVRELIKKIPYAGPAIDVGIFEK